MKIREKAGNIVSFGSLRNGDVFKGVCTGKVYIKTDKLGLGIRLDDGSSVVFMSDAEVLRLPNAVLLTDGEA